MSIELKTILIKTNLNAIINNPTLEKDFRNFFKKKEIDKLTFEKLSITITKNGEHISIKDYIHTLVDDLKALTHNFWEYYRLLTQQNNFVVLLSRDLSKYKTDYENHNLYVELIKEKIKMEKLNEVETLTLLHKTIDSDETRVKEEKIKEKMKATVQMKKKLDKKIQMMKKQQEYRKDELINIKRNLAKHQEDSRLNSDDIYKFYNDIILQITTHMSKFVTKWDRYQSIILMTSLKLHMPEYVDEKESGLTILTATPGLEKLQNIRLYLYEFEKKIVFLEETNNAEQNAKKLIDEEEAKNNRKRKKREKKKRQKSSRKAAAKQEPQPEPKQKKSSSVETAITLVKSFNLETILDETKFGNLMLFIDAVTGLLDFEVLRLSDREQVARVSAPIVAAEIKKRVPGRNSDQNFWHKCGFVIDDNLDIPLPMYLLEFFLDFKGLISNDIYREYIQSKGILSRGDGDIGDANGKIKKNRPTLIDIIKRFQALWKDEKINDEKAGRLLDKMTDITMNPDSIIKRWYDQLDSINKTLVLLASPCEEKPKKKKKKKKKKTKKKKISEKAPPTPPASPPPSPPPASPPPEAEGESKQDKYPFMKRIKDITSYLTKNNIPLKRGEEKNFIEQKENILEFIRELNKKLSRKPYKLVITGGYAIRMHGGNNKTGDIDMVLCHNNEIGTARGFITTQILLLMSESTEDVNVLQLAPGTDVNDPKNPVKIRINGVQAIDITFKNDNNNFCKEVELINGFFVLKADFMKRNLMQITNDFIDKLTAGVISHDTKLVSWLHQMTSLNKLLTARTPSPHPGGGRKTRRKKRKTKIKKRKSRKK